MFQNYLLTALRNLFKHKVFSFINIFGLALGVTACLLIFRYVRFERSFDRFHAHADRIYRVQQNRYDEGKLSTQWVAGAAGMGHAAVTEVPEVEAYSKLKKTSGVVSFGEKSFREEKMYFATEGFLPMFSYKVLKGDAANALKAPNTAVITESVARKYFGDADPMGQTIRHNGEADYRITGVMADLPAHTHLKFDLLLSFSTFVNFTSQDAVTGFNWDGFLTYLLLKEGSDIKRVEEKITAVAAKKNDPEGRSKVKTIDVKLQALPSIHLDSDFMGEAEVNGNGRSVAFLLMIAIFIIILAWVNYINLSTARALERAREVGVRKVMGSHRWQLVRQFLIEAALVNGLAMVLAIIMVVALRPFFNGLTGREVSLSALIDGGFWLALGLLFAAGSFLSGFYPAFVLSSFRPIEVLKGRLTRTAHGNLLRQSLVVFQFAASFALVVGTYSVYRQLRFMNNQELGVQIDQTLVLRGPEVTDAKYGQKLEAFKTELKKIPGIELMTASSSVPGGKVDWNAGGISLHGSDKVNQYRVFAVDNDFVNTYGLKLLAGRAFDHRAPGDSASVLFNEAAIRTLGFTKAEEAIQKKINFWGDVFTIVGVVSNHHQESLQQGYDSYIYKMDPRAQNYFSIRISEASRLEALISGTKKSWEAFFPGNPFEYFFLDDHFQKQYEADRQFGRTFALFSVLAIIVACLGLFGLVTFVTAQRTKEIGIRKISGAGMGHIIVLLTKDFIRPILLAFAIATPLTYYLVHRWLQQYAFRMEMSSWMFILPAMAILVVALFTMNLKTIRIASENPVKSLRTE